MDVNRHVMYIRSMSATEYMSVNPIIPQLEIHLCRFRILEHWHHTAMPAPFWRLYHVDRPGAWVSRGDQRVDLPTDRWTLISPGEPLQTGHDAPFAQFFIHFTLGHQFTGRHDLIHTGPLKPIHRRNIQSILSRLPEAGHSPVTIGLHISRFILHAIDSIDPHFWRPPSTDTRIRHALELIHQHMSPPLPTAILAGAVAMHPKSFSRLFSQQIGTPPHRYSLQLRLDRAITQLLHTDQTVEQIADDLGFSDRYHLTHQMKKHRRTTPGLLRKKTVPAHA